MEVESPGATYKVFGAFGTLKTLGETLGILIILGVYDVFGLR